APEKRTTVAYTRDVLDAGMSGDLLDLHVALSPCTIGYAEIGAALAPARLSHEEHPYAEWISEYAGAEFQESAQAATTRITALTTGGVSAQRFDELVDIFRTATRMDAAFWQQAIDSVEKLSLAPCHCATKRRAVASASGAAQRAETKQMPAAPAARRGLISSSRTPPMATVGTGETEFRWRKPSMPKAGGWSGLVDVGRITPTPR